MLATRLSLPLAISLVVTFIPTSARAQLEHKISSQSILRVRGPWGQAVLVHPKLEGGTITFDSLRTIDRGPLPQPLTLGDADRIQVRGSAAGSVAWKVGIVGALAGAALGMAVANIDLVGDSNTSAGTNAVGALGGAALGFGAGALLGAVIGAPIQKWKTIYRREHEAQAPSPSG